jgi:hypothetical protein
MHVYDELLLLMTGANLGAGLVFLTNGRWVPGSIVMACGVVVLLSGVGRCRP